MRDYGLIVKRTPILGHALDEPEEPDEWAEIDEVDLYIDDKTLHVADPLEPLNRVMFHFNDKVYFWVFKPVSKGYRFVVPTPIRTGVQNFFYNLAAPIRFVNCLLQGKSESAGAELSRFMFNTTVGILGFGNPAKRYPELNPQAEDLGQTLGHHGIGNGFYIVWPLLGPSTLRDTLGKVGDVFVTPVNYIPPAEAPMAISLYEKVNSTSFRIGDYETLKEAAIEPYTALRDAYIQNRQKKVSE